MTDTNASIRGHLELLLAELIELNSAAKHGSATVSLDQARVGRLSRMDALQNQAISQSAQSQRNVQIQDTKAALRRIDDGSYGYCLVCDELIAPGRLQHNPAAALCIQCAQNAE